MISRNKAAVMALIMFYAGAAYGSFAGHSIRGYWWITTIGFAGLAALVLVIAAAYALGKRSAQKRIERDAYIEEFRAKAGSREPRRPA